MRLRLEPEYLAGIAFAMASLFVASILVESPAPLFFLVFGISYVVLQATLMLSMAWARKSSKHFREALGKEMAAIHNLTVDEAKRQALEAVSDPSKFVVIANPPKQTESIIALGPRLREFFGRYESVEMRYGDLKLSRPEIGPSRRGKNFVRIGTDTGEAEVVARPGQDSVLVIDGVEEPDVAPEEYASIYHFLLACCRLVQPEK